MKENLNRLKRYVWFLIQYLLYEKPRGLDFTMRNTDLYDKSGGMFHGYSKTHEKHLHKIFESLSGEEGKGFLDIGCGKGVVLKEAAKYCFCKVDGIEIQPELVKTARRNFEILGLKDKVRCIQADAVQFDQYGDYDIFFLFNPFSKEVARKVADKIMESRGKEKRTATIIYHNPVFLSVFENRAKVIKKEMLHDSLKDYDTCILKLEKLTDGAEGR